MSQQDLTPILESIIISGHGTLQDAWDALFSFKNNGGEQMTAYQILETIKANHLNDDRIHDLTNDILDYVVGYCSATKLIWETTYDDTMD